MQLRAGMWPLPWVAQWRLAGWLHHCCAIKTSLECHPRANGSASSLPSLHREKSRDEDKTQFIIPLTIEIWEAWVQVRSYALRCSRCNVGIVAGPQSPMHLFVESWARGANRQGAVVARLCC